jgi:SOS-response transcriptional repressor LexA
MDPDQLRRRILERLEATGKKRVTVSTQIGKGRDYLSNFLNGEKDSLAAGVLPQLAEILECRLEYFVDAAVDEPMSARSRGEPHVRIIGRVGADAEGTIIQTGGQQAYDEVPLPPGGTPKAVALEVVGDSMTWFAEDGSLVYFEDQRTPPTEDMIGYYVICELEDGRVLIKRLLRGSKPGLYSLMSQRRASPPIEDVRIVWAAEPIAIIPPKQAQQIIRRADEHQDA